MPLIATLALAGAIAAQPADPQRAADIAALTDAKLNQWPAFYRNNDADGLADFLAEGFVAYSGEGTETRAQAVAWVRDNRWQAGDRNFSYDIADIVFHSPDVANVYGVGSYDGRGAAGPCRMRYTSANIFVRQQGRWRAAYSHTSDSACVAASAR